MRSTRLLNFVSLSVLLILVIMGGTFALGRYEKLQAIRGAESRAVARLADMNEQTRSKRDSLARLNHDPEYVERVIRQKLNYAKAEETVFKFESAER